MHPAKHRPGFQRERPPARYGSSLSAKQTIYQRQSRDRHLSMGERALTSKAAVYSSQLATFILPNRPGKASLFFISSVDPTTLSAKKLAAAPPPNANIASRFPSSISLSTCPRRDERHAYSEAVYMFPHRLEHASPGSTVFLKLSFESAMSARSIDFSVMEEVYGVLMR